MSHRRRSGHAKCASSKSSFRRFATLAAIAALFLLRPALAQEGSGVERYPLEPPDLSSPEATLNTFLTEATAAIDAIDAGDRAEMEARADRGFQTLEIAMPKCWRGDRSSLGQGARHRPHGHHGSERRLLSDAAHQLHTQRHDPVPCDDSPASRNQPGSAAFGLEATARASRRSPQDFFRSSSSSLHRVG